MRPRGPRNRIVNENQHLYNIVYSILLQSFSRARRARIETRTKLGREEASGRVWLRPASRKKVLEDLVVVGERQLGQVV